MSGPVTHLKIGLCGFILALGILASVSQIGRVLPALAQPKAQLTMTLASRSVEARPGGQNSYVVTLSSIGGNGVDRVQLSASGPIDWRISFDPSATMSLLGNQPATVNVTLTPPRGVIRGTYDVFLNANSASGLFASAMLQVRVTPPSYLVWVVVAFVLVVVGLFAAVFIRMSRRS